MRLPNPGKASIPREKIHDYLLSPVHSVGRHKAVFFGSLGYTQDQWQLLEQDIRALVRKEVSRTVKTEFGTKYEIRGSITGPSGSSSAIVSAWMVLEGEEIPRFITAYPED